MTRFFAFFAVVALAALPVISAASPQKNDPYLTKDGKLAERLELLQLQGGFAGLTGTYTAIEPDGSWSTGQVKMKGGPQKGPATGEGKLTAEQLQQLAATLAKQDLATLPDHGKTETNPRVVVLQWGKKTATLQPKSAGGMEDQDKAIRARYQEIATAVRALTGKGEKKDPSK